MIESSLIAMAIAATISVAAFLYGRPLRKENSMLLTQVKDLHQQNKELVAMISVEKELVLAAKLRADEKLARKEKDKGRDRWNPVSHEDADEDLYHNEY